MTKKTRLPLPNSPIFASRGSKVKWPTLRGSFLTDRTVTELQKYAYGVIFLDGTYNTRLNFDHKPSLERAVFFEHLHNMEGGGLFLLCWVGNFHGGAIFHCAWQYPQNLHWTPQALERAAFETYKKVAYTLYTPIGKMDAEVHAFCSQVIP